MREPSTKKESLEELVRQYEKDRDSGIRPDIKQIVSRNPEAGPELESKLREIERSWHQKANQSKSEATVVSYPPDNEAEGTQVDPDDANRTFVDEEFIVRQSVQSLRIICPHCKTAMSVDVETEFSSIICEHCDTRFSLVSSETDFEQGLTFVSHFELLERVGVGSFGTVWRAQDTELDRIVSIKMPRKGQLTSDEVKAFLREAQACAQVRHPNIVRVYEIGKSDNRVFIASEFIEGQSLADEIDDSIPTLERAVQITKTCAEALHVAHQAGIVHRDLKPANILIDEKGEPHIADFGMAKRNSDVTMTVDGAIMGTPAYMSPEQARGTAHDSDARSDIYSLGVVLFKMVTGELPFRGNTAMVLDQVINQEAPSPRKLNHQVPRDIETICLRCMDKLPFRRFQTAQELADELGRYLNGQPILARPVGWIEKSVKWCRRHVALSFALATIVLVSLLGTVIGLYLSLQATKAQNVAQLMKSEAIRLKEEAENLTQLAKRQIYASDMSRVQTNVEQSDLAAAKSLLIKYQPIGSEEDVRGFEWHYWWNQCNTGLIGAADVSEVSNCVTVSPDSLRTIWADRSGNLFHSDLSLQETEIQADAHTSVVNDLDFSPDSSCFVSGSDDGKAKIWDSNSRSLLRELDLKLPVWCVRFWNEGKWLVVGCRFDNAVIVTVFDWEAEKAMDQFQIPGRFPAIATANDNCHLSVATFVQNGSLMVRDCKAQVTKWSVTRSAGFDDPLFVQDNTKVLCCCNGVAGIKGSAFLIYDVKTGTLDQTIANREGNQNISRILRDNRGQVITANGDGAIDIFSESDFSLIQSLVGHSNRNRDLEVANDGSLISSGDDKRVQTWTSVTESNPRKLELNRYLGDLEYSPDGKTVLVAAEDSLLMLDARTLETRRKISLPGMTVSDVSFSKDGQQIALAARFSNQIQDYQTGIWCLPISMKMSDPVVTLPKGQSCEQVGFDTAGDLFFARSDSTAFTLDHPVYVYRHSLATNETKVVGENSSQTHHMALHAFGFSQNEEFLATSSRDRTVKVWNLKDNTLEYSKRREGSSNPIGALDVSVDDLIATGASDGTIRIWPLDDPDDPSLMKSFLAHDATIRELRFAPDGKTLISISFDQTIKIWDVRTGQLRTSLIGHQSRITSVAMSPDQSTIISGDDQGVMYQWSTGLEQRD